jgi:uncharacterized protein YjbI with pentapeptide repeats
LEIVNRTPFQFAHIVGRLPFPNHSLTLIVKGTFDLSPGRKVTPAKEQLYPTGDEYYPDDDEMAGSPRYESDFAYFKPRADLLLVGNCHPPGGKPAPACKVTFSVGEKSKSLLVLGNRCWKRNVFCLWAMTDPEPFSKMILRYENSFGGKEYKKNPVGKGCGRQKTKTGKSLRPLPNIENPDALVIEPGSRLDPAGYGPLGRMWHQRQSKLGTYKGNYLKERWPWFPLDFDWGHFNAASPDMQLEKYLKGDEPLCFENLHPECPQYKAQLPGLNVRCFLNHSTEEETDQTRFNEVAMNLDTLWVDMEAEKLILVWRGWAKVGSEDYEEVQHVFIMSEPVDQEPESIEQSRKLFLARLAEMEKEWATETEEPEAIETSDVSEEPDLKTPVPEEPIDAKIAGLEVPEAEKRMDISPKEIEAQVSAILAQAGVDLESFPPHVREKMKEGQSRIMKRMTEQDPAKVMKQERAELQAQIKDACSTLGIDMGNLPPMSEKAKAEQIRFVRELGIQDVDMEGNQELATFLTTMNAVLPQMGIDPENLSPLIEEAKKQQEQIKKQLGIEAEAEEEGITKEEEETAPSLTREIVEERVSRGDSFAGQDLSGLDLSGLMMKGINFSSAIFTNTLLKKGDLGVANLTNARLMSADLSDAILTNANLQGAELSEAILINANLEGADLSDANLTHANLAGADLSNVNFTGAVLAGADLSGANLKKACLKDADATRAKLTGCRISGAVLSDAVFEKAKIENAILDHVEAKDTYFTEADLSGAKLKNSHLVGADFSKCLLHNADFQGSNLSEASVEGALGIKINFADTDLSGLRASEGCDFSQGSFRKAKGQESIWEEAKLNDADFSFSRMEGANFTKASMERANLYAADMKFSRFVRANLKQAKLVRMNLFEGSLEKADLTETDLRGSNLYGVEFLDAVIDQTVLEGANLKMTKRHRNGKDA